MTRFEAEGLNRKVVWLSKHIAPQPEGVVFSDQTILMTFLGIEASKSLKYFANYMQRDQI